MTKYRVHIRIPADIHEQLTLASKSPAMTQSDIVAEALRLYFNPMRSTTVTKPITRRLDAMAAQQNAMARELVVAVETLAMFTRYWFTATPALSDADRKAAHVAGAQRYEQFFNQVTKTIATQRGMSQRRSQSDDETLFEDS